MVRLPCISVMRIMRKSFATNYAGDTHGRRDTSDEPVSDAVNQQVWGLSDHRYMATVPDEDLLKVIKRGEAAIGESPVIMAFGEALSGDDIGDLVAFILPFAQSISSTVNFKLLIERHVQPQPLQDVLLQL